MGKISAAGLLRRLQHRAASHRAVIHRAVIHRAASHRAAEATPLRPSADSDVMRSAAPGWYYDPLDEAVYRYWDGEVWTDERSDLFPSSQPA